MAFDYTSTLKEGDTTFEQFATLCMRNFGACISSEGTYSDKPLKLHKPNVREYVNGLRRVTNRRNKIRKLTRAELAYDVISTAQEQYKQNLRNLEDIEKLLKRYDDMLIEINGWNPPSPEHIELKKFMLTQIHDSIVLDCRTKIEHEEMERIKNEIISFDPVKERKRLLEIAEYEIDFFNKSIYDERERVRVRNKWITDAIKSFKLPRTTLNTKIDTSVASKMEAEMEANIPCDPSPTIRHCDNPDSGSTPGPASSVDFS